jgi:mannobiose 2-epimerase
MINEYKELKNDLKIELENILNYWANNTLDQDFGGFLGKRDHFNKIVKKSSKGVILNTRILWSFSAASNHLKTEKYEEICHRAYHYLNDFFRDTINKGVFWELDYLGNPINKRKQVYAQSFTIYALSEYYIFTKNEEAKKWAIEIFNLLEKHAKDTLNKGYFEAFKEDWSPIKDMRLSHKDINASKTMNTHLHVLEAYTSLLKIYDNQQLKESLNMLVEVFLEKFLNTENHYELFFDNEWNLLSDFISFGHDIEAAWLLIEAAKMIGGDEILQKTKRVALKVADTFLAEAIDKKGAVINEKNRRTNHTDTDRHWWSQVEALVGLKYANDIEHNQKYINASLKIWEFTKEYLIDTKNGEWFFRIDKNEKVYINEDKVSMWKAPYHTTRACVILTR